MKSLFFNKYILITGFIISCLIGFSYAEASKIVIDENTTTYEIRNGEEYIFKKAVETSQNTSVFSKIKSSDNNNKKNTTKSQMVANSTKTPKLISKPENNYVYPATVEESNEENIIKDESVINTIKSPAKNKQSSITKNFKNLKCNITKKWTNKADSEKQKFYDKKNNNKLLNIDTKNKIEGKELAEKNKVNKLFSNNNKKAISTKTKVKKQSATEEKKVSETNSRNKKSIDNNTKGEKQSAYTKIKEKLSLKTNKKETNTKLQFKKHSLTDINETRNIKNIKEHINNEDFFSHNAKNKLYLDRFKTFGAYENKKTFYEKKNIVENENGDIEVKLGNGREIDKLIEEIEQSNPNGDAIEISLRDSIAISLAKHPSILSAKMNTEIYRSMIMRAWSAYMPTFSAGFNWDYNYTKYHGYHFGEGYNSVFLPNVSAGMLIYDFGKNKATIDMATTDYDASRYNLQDSINEIIYNIKSAYFNVIFAEKQVEIYNKTIEDFDLQLASAQKYFSIGKKPQIDVLTAETNAGNARLNLVQAINTLENAKVTFANVLGLPEFANFKLSDNLQNNEYNIDLEKLLQDAFNIRPDLLSYEKSVESNYLALRRAKRYFTPDLNLNGGLSYSDIADNNTSNYKVGLDLSYAGFNFVQLKKDYDIAKKTYEKSLADYETKRQQVYLEVKQAYIDYNNTKEGIKQAELNVKQAKAQHYHATGRYKAGYGDAIEMKDAENTYLNAQLAYYQSLLSYNLSLSELEKVVGRPIENNNLSENNTLQKEKL